MSDTNPAAAQPNDLGRSTPGEYLRRLREEKGLTHAAVGTALHLTVHYIKALEGDEYGKLPGLTFVKGYLRSYARYLGADVNTVLARFDEHITGLLDAGQHTARVERSKRRQDQALRWGVGAGLVVVGGIVAGWWFMRDAQPVNELAARSVAAERQQVVAETPAPAPAPVASTPAATFTAPVQDTATAGQPNAFAANDQDPFDQDALDPNAFDQGNAGNAFETASQPMTSVAGASTEQDAALAAPEGTVAYSPVAEQNEFGGTAPEAPAVASITGSNEPPVAAASAPGATVTEASATAPAASAAPATGARQISLIGAGNDELRLGLKGSSWIEVTDGSSARLFSDTLSSGDSLTIRGQGPFRVVLGDAMNVDVALNAKAVDINPDIRADRTARLVLGAPAAGTSPSATSAAPGTSAPAATGAEVTP